MSSIDFSRRSGGIEGRPVAAYIASNVGESSSSAWSANFLMRRAGWSFGTTLSGDMSTSIEDCFFCSLEVSGHVAANYFYNFENADGRDNGGINAGGVPAYPFTPDSNSFTLDQVWIGIERPVSEDERAGFRVIGTRERIGRHHGAWRDVMLVERRSPAVS